MIRENVTCKYCNNCRFIKYTDNSSKGFKSIITIEQLLERIKLFEKIQDC